MVRTQVGPHPKVWFSKPFFMAYCYILHSKSLNRFYIGATNVQIDLRIDKHLNHFYGDDSFTAKANDWIIFHTIECDSMEQAVKIEKHIKKMKSKAYINNLVKFPDLSFKLKQKYR